MSLTSEKTPVLEGRYRVFKNKDLQSALAEGLITHDQLLVLNEIGAAVNQVRRNREKPPLQCVVVEADWPFYGKTARKVLALNARFFWLGGPSEVYVGASLDVVLDKFCQDPARRKEIVEKKLFGEIDPVGKVAEGNGCKLDFFDLVPDNWEDEPARICSQDGE